MTNNNPQPYTGGSGTSPTIVAGSAIGAIAAGIPGAIVGGIVGAVIDEFTMRCPRCGSKMRTLDRECKELLCPYCGHYEKKP